MLAENLYSIVLNKNPQKQYETPCKFYEIVSPLTFGRNKNSLVRSDKTSKVFQNTYALKVLMEPFSIESSDDSRFFYAKQHYLKSIQVQNFDSERIQPVCPNICNLEQPVYVQNYGSCSLQKQTQHLNQESSNWPQEQSYNFNCPSRSLLLNNQSQAQKKRQKQKILAERGQKLRKDPIYESFQITKAIEKRTFNFQQAQTLIKRQRSSRTKFWQFQRRHVKSNKIVIRKRKDFRQILFKQNQHPMVQYYDLKLSSQVLKVILVVNQMSVLQLNTYILLKVRVFLRNISILVEDDKIVVYEIQGRRSVTLKQSGASKIVNSSSKSVKIQVKMYF